MKTPALRQSFSLPRWSPALAIAAGATLIYLAFLAPGIYSIDGNSKVAG